MPEANRLEQALREAGIPCRLELQVTPPALVLTVPEDFLEEARSLADELQDAMERAQPAAFPWGPFRLCAGLALLHLGLVAALVGPHPTLARLLRLGALQGDRFFSEPWRLLTSLFLHADVLHAAWNGLALVAFGVPVAERWGLGRATAIYLGAGIGGGLVAMLQEGGGTVILGASGAISGLFGAWLVDRVGRLRRRRRRTPRDVVRIVGIGLLYLPALLNPTTPEGGRISVAAHVGGLIAGALLTSGFLHREARAPLAERSDTA
ncbi:MAG TPA: rhomboid family intramembrane serine protease [Candidatus Polarisedimenticolaceae bacterium]|nr:rhomboid family intramembrane serine protease [Candidatus Polarisedimenticolaceae bacterium]